jgi:hypothetical protein
VLDLLSLNLIKSGGKSEMKGRTMGMVAFLCVVACGTLLALHCMRQGKLSKMRQKLFPKRDELGEIEQGIFRHGKIKIKGLEKEPKAGSIFFSWARGEITHSIGLRAAKGSFSHKSKKTYFLTKATLTRMLMALNDTRKMRMFLEAVSKGTMLEPVPGDPERSLDAYVYKTLVLLLGINRVRRSREFRQVYCYIHFVNSEHRKIDVAVFHDPKNPVRTDLSTLLMEAINEYIIEMNALHAAEDKPVPPAGAKEDPATDKVPGKKGNPK